MLVEGSELFMGSDGQAEGSPPSQVSDSVWFLFVVLSCAVPLVR